MQVCIFIMLIVYGLGESIYKHQDSLLVCLNYLQYT